MTIVKQELDAGDYELPLLDPSGLEPDSARGPQSIHLRNELCWNWFGNVGAGAGSKTPSGPRVGDGTSA